MAGAETRAGTVVVAGLNSELIDQLDQRLPDVLFITASTSQELFAHTKDAQVVLLEDSTSGLPGLAALELLSGVGTRVFYLAQKGQADDHVKRAMKFGAERLFLAPIDVDELVHAIADVLEVVAADAPTPRTQAPTVASVGERPAVEPAPAPGEGLERIWEKYRPMTMGQVDSLDRAVAMLRNNDLDADDRREAERNAHKLAGACGTFGFNRASEIAREMEKLLDAGTPLGDAETHRLADLAVALRASLEGWI